MSSNTKDLPFGMPQVGEEERRALLEVLDSGRYVHGPKMELFEERFAAFSEAPHAVSVASCTAAMHLVYFHLGLSQGDEVICPAQTHTATAHAIEVTGAKPVFVDAEAKFGNMDVEQIEAAITKHTRAIAVVHYLGLPADMPAITALAKRHDLFVLEDCALSVGARVDGVHTGLLGDVGCFSFYPVKHMTTAEGGMVVTRHEKLATALRAHRAFGMTQHVGKRKFPGLYDIPALGFNYRMNEFEAALGAEQILKVPQFLEKRKINYARLKNHLADVDGISGFAEPFAGVEHSHYCYVMLLDENLAAKRFELIGYLKGQGVGTSIYYPHPVPEMGYYREKYGYGSGEYPVAARISNHSIALPVGPHLEPADMDRIAETVRSGLQSVGVCHD
jgi:perosamine synthetase